jgi:hypothetical protein
MTETLSPDEISELAAELRELAAEAQAAGAPLDDQDLKSAIKAAVVFAAELQDDKILAGKQVLDALHEQAMAASKPAEFATLQEHYQDASARHERELDRVITQYNLTETIEQVAAEVAVASSHEPEPTQGDRLRPGSFFYIGPSLDALAEFPRAEVPDLMQHWLKYGGAFDRAALGDRRAIKAAKRRCKAIQRCDPKAPELCIYASDFIHEDVPDLTYSEYTGLSRS